MGIYWRILVVLVTGISFVSKPVFSQPVPEIFRVAYTLSPKIELKNNDGEVFNTPVNYLKVALNFPILQSRQWVVINEIKYNQFYTDITDYGPTHVNIHDITNMGFGIKAVKKSGSFNLLFTAETVYGSTNPADLSFKKLNYKFGTGILWKYKSRPFELVGFGIGASTDYGAPLVIPFLTIGLKVNRQFRIDAFLPFQSRFSFSLSPKTKTGLYHDTHFEAFYFNNNVKTDSLQFGKIRSLSMGLFIEQKLYNHIYLFTGYGFITGNSFLIYDYKNRQIDELKSNRIVFVNFGLSLKINKDAPEF